MNRLVFIVPFRNVRNYIQQCCQSLILQKNKSWIAIFCDDASEDDTVSFIPNDTRFRIRRNEKRLTALPNIHYGIINSELDDEDIICILDGDDYLITEEAVDIIYSLYDDGTLLTYGQYVWPDGRIGHCKGYTKKEFDNLRSGGYWASHLRTFKYKLYKEILRQDPNLKCFKNDLGEFYNITYDVAIMTPLMEIAGFERIKFNPIPIYFYRIHLQNDHVVNESLQRQVAEEIFKKNKFNLL